jgi:hypothetical protein
MSFENDREEYRIYITVSRKPTFHRNIKKCRVPSRQYSASFESSFIFLQKTKKLFSGACGVEYGVLFLKTVLILIILSKSRLSIVKLLCYLDSAGQIYIHCQHIIQNTNICSFVVKRNCANTKKNPEQSFFTFITIFSLHSVFIAKIDKKEVYTIILTPINNINHPSSNFFSENVSSFVLKIINFVLF